MVVNDCQCNILNVQCNWGRIFVSLERILAFKYSQTIFHSSWHSDVVTTLSQLRCSHCHNVVIWSTMRVVLTSVFDVVTKSISYVIETLLQRCCNVATTFCIGFRGHFTTNYLIFFLSSKCERVTKVLSGIKHTPSLFKRSLYL